MGLETTAAPATGNTVNVGKRSRLREAALPTLVGIAVLIGSLLNLLSSQHYPLFTPEVGLLTVGLVGIALSVGLLYAASDPIARGFLQVLLLLLALDLNFDGNAVPIATLAVAAVVNRRLMPFLGIASLVVIATELPSVSFTRASEVPVSSPAGAGDPSLPVLVHVILDEHIGIEGLTADDDARAMGDRLRSFYLANGFRLFGAAYSEHMRTVRAIPALLNFGQEQPWKPEIAKKGAFVSNNRYFDLLKQRGYALNVYQTHFLNYCEHPAISFCQVRPNSSLLSLETPSLAAPDKAILLAHTLARLSTLARKANNSVSELTGIGTNLRDDRLPQAIPALETLHLLADRVRHAGGGTAFFAHVLIPHYPYVFDSDCRAKPLANWLHRRDTPLAPHPTRNRGAAYYDQLSCILTALQPIFDAAGPNAILIVQGDHGSRITETDPHVNTVGRFTASDLIAAYSTLYAVRAPAISPGYDGRPLPIGQLLGELVLSGFRSAAPNMPSGFTPSVVLDRSDWRPAGRHPMPSDWPLPE
jgi:hypothetical protein